MADKEPTTEDNKKQPKKTLALLSMIFGIVGLGFIWNILFLWLNIPLLIASLILGIIAIAKIKKGIASGKGMAIAGIIISGISVVVVPIVVISLSAATTTIDSIREDLDNPSNSQTQNDKSSTKELSESQKMKNKIYDLIDEGLAYNTGDYVEGEVKAGEYAFIRLGSSWSSYYSEEDSAGNIIDNENFDSFGYVKVHALGDLETNGILVNISAFEQLGISGAKELYEIVNEKENYNQSGYYKVGYDIEVGSYMVESIGGSGYYSIESGPVGNSNIIDNDNFSGKASVTLSNGQYLSLSRATINKK